MAKVKRRRTNPGPGKVGGDGFTDRQRAFVRERRADTVAPMWQIMERAGYLGTRSQLGVKAVALMAKPEVSAAVFAPSPVAERDISDEDGLKRELRRFFLSVVRSSATAADKIKAADKLGSTLQGFYQPVSVDLKGRVTMEGIVRAMGGAPDEDQPALPEHLDHKEAN